MTVRIDAEFFNRHANVIIQSDSKEKLERVVNFLINCPDPHNFSDPGKHAHFFIVETRLIEGKYRLHVSRAAMNCISWWLHNREWVKEGKS